MGLTQVITSGIKDNAVTDAKLPASSVGSSELKDDAVGPDQIANSAIVNASVDANAAIATSKLSGAITNIPSHGLATSATTDATNAANITTGTLPAARIGDDSIVESKLDVSNAPSDGYFLKYTSNELTWGTAAFTGTLLDEDDMSSNSASQAPSQQSVKAYVDNLNWLNDTNRTDGSAIYWNNSASKYYADADNNIKNIEGGNF